MKKILNNNNEVVQDMIDGWTISNDKVLQIENVKVVVRSDCQEIKDKYVSLISGGGSGHEPSHCGFIGDACLSAAVCGEVFASPNPKQVLEAIKAVCGSKGCILIVKNYTGDRLNFGIAQMMAQTEYGLRVEMIIVDDDVSSILQNYDQLVMDNGDNLTESFKSIQNRRGIAGTVLVHKILGALSKQGKSIDEIVQFYNKFLSPSNSLYLNTMGVGLSSCTIPAIGTPSFSLKDNEMELGLGIHGEPGISKTILDTSENITKTLIDNILKILPNNSSKQLIVLINNLGSTTNMELAVIAKDVLNYLNEKRFIVERLIQGTLMTSLEMAGISITILSFNNNESNILELIDYHTSAPAWPTNSVLKPNIKSKPLQYNKNEESHKMNYEELKSIIVSDETSNIIKNMVLFSCRALLENEHLLTDLDSRVGDGDLGLTLERAANNILKFIEVLPFSQPCYTFRKMSTILQDTLGGSSGPFYSIFFLKLSSVLYEHSKDTKSISLDAWSNALVEAANAIGILGKSKVGDCTMLDSLIPAVLAVKNSIDQNKSENFDLPNTIKLACDAAHKGANDTIEMMAKKGRSSYLGKRSVNNMDPGAAAISIIIQSFKNILLN